MTNYDEAYHITLTVEQARLLLDVDIPENLAEALDGAQGDVFSEASKEAYVIITVTR
jgi:hypothetical protein